MDVLLLRYWQLVLGLVIGVVLTAWVGFWWHGERVADLELEHATKAKNQVAAAVKQCRASKNITEGVARELLDQKDDLAERLAAAERMYGNRCIRPVHLAERAAGADARSGAGHVGGDEIPAGGLVRFAGRGTSFQVELRGLQQMVCWVWAANGEPLPYPVCAKANASE